MHKKYKHREHRLTAKADKKIKAVLNNTRKTVREFFAERNPQPGDFCLPHQTCSMWFEVKIKSKLFPVDKRINYQEKPYSFQFACFHNRKTKDFSAMLITMLLCNKKYIHNLDISNLTLFDNFAMKLGFFNNRKNKEKEISVIDTAENYKPECECFMQWTKNIMA